MIYHSRGEKSIKGLEIATKLCYLISVLIKLINAVINFSTRTAISSTFLFFSLSFMFSPPKIKKISSIEDTSSIGGGKKEMQARKFTFLSSYHFHLCILHPFLLRFCDICIKDKILMVDRRFHRIFFLLVRYY